MSKDKKIEYLEVQLRAINRRLIELDNRLDKYDEIEVLTLQRDFCIEEIEALKEADEV
ncbi:MAG: hypothetical protein IKO45_04965 [Clostridia bacterium]|nr:hypothetical protein [Clostridia bacterium]MBR4623885.1 hypothetical protein [Clostridia bacterium]